jgi:hypothetical protein
MKNLPKLLEARGGIKPPTYNNLRNPHTALIKTARHLKSVLKNTAKSDTAFDTILVF